MKINFDDLFSRVMPLTTIPSTFSQQKPHNIQPQQSPVKSTQTYLKNIELASESKQQNSHSILQKLNKLTKIIEDKQELSKKKTKVNIQELTNKLYQPAASKKKACSKNIKATKQPRIDPCVRHQHTLKTRHQSSAQIGFPRFVRLYNLSKINSIRNLYRAESHRAEFDRQHIKQQHRTKTSESYLQNYVPFYDRLQSEVNRSLQKQKFYDNNPQLACGQLKQLFKPTTIPDKYKDKIECRYNRSTKSTKNTNELEQALNSSFNTSFCSLDKSVQIINRVEEHFFNKMKLIFLNHSQQYVVITEHVINMLSEIQFKILHNFVMEAEINPIHNEDFESRLRDYYYNLHGNERLELRNHQTKKKAKASQQLAQKGEQLQKSFKKKAPQVSKYLKKVENFI